MSRSFLLALITAAAPAQVEAIAEPRVLYTEHDGGCYSITDRAECCQHKDGRNYSKAGHYYHERCVPSAVGTTFTSGRVCEPECWVTGSCGDGSPQTDRIGQCLDLDDNLLVVSEDTSSRTTTLLPVITTVAEIQPITTVAEIQPTPGLSKRDKVIVGAVTGSVGGVALLGGLLGGLLTSTAPPASGTLSPARFLEGPSTANSTIAERLGSPWLAVLALGALVVLAVSAVVKSQRHGARNVPGNTELSQSSDEESMSPTPRGPADTFTSAFDLVDTNHDGVISQEEFNAAFGRQHTILSMASPVYVQPPSLVQA